MAQNCLPILDTPELVTKMFKLNLLHSCLCQVESNLSCQITGILQIKTKLPLCLYMYQLLSPPWPKVDLCHMTLDFKATTWEFLTPSEGRVCV